MAEIIITKFNYMFDIHENLLKINSLFDFDFYRRGETCLSEIYLHIIVPFYCFYY